MMQDDFYTPQIYFDQVHEGIVLPQDICDHLLQTMVQEGLDIDYHKCLRGGQYHFELGETRFRGHRSHLAS